MASMVLRCQYKGGRRNNLEGLSANSTVADLQEKIWLLTDVPPHAQRILLGFPPKQLICEDKSDSLSSLDIRSGDTLIIEEDKKALRVPLDSYKKSLGSAALGKLTRKVVPADNSCLFTSVSYVMVGDSSCSAELRKLIAQCVSNDPLTFNTAFLGQDNSDYCNWILNKDNWGGAIELSILSKHYQTEIAVVDIETGRVDRYGEGIGYSKCVYLIYDGIHYDPLAVQSSDRTKEPLQTVFPVGDDMRLAEALEIAAGAKQVRIIDSNRNANSRTYLNFLSAASSVKHCSLGNKRLNITQLPQVIRTLEKSEQALRLGGLDFFQFLLDSEYGQRKAGRDAFLSALKCGYPTEVVFKCIHEKCYV